MMFPSFKKQASLNGYLIPPNGGVLPIQERQCKTKLYLKFR